MKMKLCERIIELMDEKGFNGEQLAKAVNVSCSAVSQWKNDKYEISIDNIFALAKHFKCSIDYIVGRTDKDNGFSEKDGIFLDRLHFLLKKNTTTLYRLDKDGILSKSTYYTWKRGSAPRLSNVIPIADYFNCSLDFLLGCK